MSGAKLDSAYAAAERLGKSIGGRLVTDVARVLPASKNQETANIVGRRDTVALAYSSRIASRQP
jgi:hypothetical protein